MLLWKTKRTVNYTKKQRGKETKNSHTPIYWYTHCLKWKTGHTRGRASYYQLNALPQPSLSVLHDVRNTLVSSPSRTAIVLIFYEHVLNHKSWAEAPAGSRSTTYQCIRLQVKDKAEEEVTYTWLTHKYVMLSWISKWLNLDFQLSFLTRGQREKAASGPPIKSP